MLMSSAESAPAHAVNADNAEALCMPCSGRAGVDAGPARGQSCNFLDPPGLGCDTGSSLSVLRVRTGTEPALQSQPCLTVAQNGKTKTSNFAILTRKTLRSFCCSVFFLF